MIVQRLVVRLLHVTFVHKVQQSQGEGGGHKEHQVEPPVVEVELEVPEDGGDDGAVLARHVHPHQDDHGGEVHPHDLREDEDDDVGAFGRGDPDEELGHGEEETPGGADDDDADHDEGDVLGPELDVYADAEPVDGDVESLK